MTKWAAVVLLMSCAAAHAEISAAMFKHRFIARELPGKQVGAGASALADFDKDGDLDFAVFNRGDGKLYWFEQRTKDDWAIHPAGTFRVSQLGCASADIDGDGWIDIIVGGYWFRNTGKPREEEFVRYAYDDTLKGEIHDVVLADIDGDGRKDLAVLGDRDGCFWYAIPEKPAQDGNWPRNTITLAVRTDQIGIHSGIYPNGIADLDNDGDNDVVTTDRWYVNEDRGKRWSERRLNFGRKGPWSMSSRAWIKDVNGDGRADIVMADSDGQNSAVAWLQSDGRTPPSFRARYLANKAPGTRGSFHSLRLADFDGDGDDDILAVEQEDPSIPPVGATPRWIVFENVSKGADVRFEERVILDANLGGHDVHVGDVDGDGDLDIVSKIWAVSGTNANGGRVHVDWLENLRRK